MTPEAGDDREVCPSCDSPSPRVRLLVQQPCGAAWHDEVSNSAASAPGPRQVVPLSPSGPAGVRGRPVERWCAVAFCGMPALPHTNVCAECESNLLEGDG